MGLDWISITGPMLASLVVVLLTHLRGRRPGGLTVFSVFAVFCMGGIELNRHIADQRRIQSALAKMDVDPVMIAVKRDDPQIYAKMRQAIADTAILPASERDGVFHARMDPLLGQVLVERARNPNDDIIVETAQLSNDLLRYRMKSDPRACETQAQLMQSHDIPATEAVISSSVGLDRYRRYVSDVIVSSPGPQHAAVTAEDRLSWIRYLMPMVLAREGGSMEQFMASVGTPGGKCRLALDMVDAALSLPKNQAATAIRVMGTHVAG